MKRREFLKALAGLSVGASAPVEVWGAAIKAGSPDLRVGVLSDIHLYALPGDKMVYGQTMFRKALEYFRLREVDGVLVAGDMANTGNELEHRAIAETWFGVFPDGKLPNGSPVVNLMHYGDHDSERRIWLEVEKKFREYCAKSGTPMPCTTTDPANQGPVWERYYREKWSPIQVKQVKGYTFVLAHFMAKTVGWNEGLDKVLAGADVAGDKPFFFSQHRAYRNTPLAKWGPDAGRNGKVLANYPNCVAFCGHTHYTLTDDAGAVWKGPFTAINTGSLLNQACDYGRENGVVPSWYQNDPNAESQMSDVMASNVHAGWVMNVYGKLIVLERRDFGSGLSLGPDLVFTVGERERDHTKDEPPVFAPGSVTVTQVSGVDRKKRPTEQLRVEFPSAPSSARTPRAKEYRVCAYAANAELIKEKLVFSQKTCYPEQLDVGRVCCLFSIAELRGAKGVTFTVEPLDCWGNAGTKLVLRGEWSCGSGEKKNVS